ncbi:MAG: hypothetical protein ACK4IS_09245 [Erythrobacter sp.]
MDLESNLARLGAAPLPDLSGLDGAALALRAQAEVRTARGAMALALVAALGIGMIGGMQPPATAEAPLAAFGPAPALTPLIGLAAG